MKKTESKLRYMVEIVDTAIATLKALDNINDKHFEQDVVEKFCNKDIDGLKHISYDLLKELLEVT